MYRKNICKASYIAIFLKRFDQYLNFASSEKQLGMSDKEKGKKGKGGGDEKKKAKVPSGITAASRNNPDGGGTKKGKKLIY